jgi:4-hydroxythreonine-4-phosphate dehydrogenase
MEDKENKALIRVGISIGDINGIGPEVVLKAVSDNRLLQDCVIVIYTSAKVLSFYKKTLPGLEFNFQSLKTADQLDQRKVNIVNCWNEEVQIEPGSKNETGGQYAFLSLEAATADLAANKIDVLVTAPIAKETIQKAGFNFPGHTEYLADMSGVKEALMMMVSDNLRVALVTSHVSLKEVAQTITKEKIIEKLNALNNSLRKDFKIIRPRIAVLGLNPHAGEKGVLGSEETDVISPAIQVAKQEGLLVNGPFPADGFFGSSALTQYDAVLAMYHDQGLAPFKALAFDSGVNFTAGLPVVRTSPDHGTAFDIAGKGEASEQSFRNALYLALDVYRNREFMKEIETNPLKISPLTNKGRE